MHTWTFALVQLDRSKQSIPRLNRPVISCSLRTWSAKYGVATNTSGAFLAELASAKQKVISETLSELDQLILGLTFCFIITTDSNS